MIEWTDSKNLELLYRSSRDGEKSETFHKFCDNKGPTISLFKSKNGYIFGGFASISWTSDLGTKSAQDSFLFTLTNIFGIGPLKFPSIKNDKELYNNNEFGQCFGFKQKGFFNVECDIKIIDNSFSSFFPLCYMDTINKGNIIFTGSKGNSKLQEIEVFKSIK